MVWRGPCMWGWASVSLHSKGALCSLGTWSLGWPHIPAVSCERRRSSADSGPIRASLRSPMGEEEMVTHVTRAPQHSASESP